MILFCFLQPKSGYDFSYYLSKSLHHKTVSLQENPNPQPYVQKVPKPTEGSHERIHQPQFHELDMARVQSIIDEGIAKHSIKNK